MWGKAAYTATYLLNRSPTKLLDVTPYEMWNGKEPDMSLVKLFGCAAYAKNLGALKKLDSRTRKLVFVGYSPKGYRLWDAKNRRIILSRDVTFEEKIENITKNRKGILEKGEHIEEEKRRQTEKEESEESDQIETNNELED